MSVTKSEYQSVDLLILRSSFECIDFCLSVILYSCILGSYKVHGYVPPLAISREFSGIEINIIAGYKEHTLVFYIIRILFGKSEFIHIFIVFQFSFDNNIQIYILCIVTITDPR